MASRPELQGPTWKWLVGICLAVTAFFLTREFNSMVQRDNDLLKRVETISEELNAIEKRVTRLEYVNPRGASQ